MEAVLHWLGVKKAIALVSLIGAIVSLRFMPDAMTPGGKALMVLGGWSSAVYGTETVMFYAGIPDKHHLGAAFFVALFSMSLCAAIHKAINSLDLGGAIKSWISKRRD